MAAHRSEKKYREHYADARMIFQTLSNDCGLRVYWAAQQISSKRDFDMLDLSIDTDLNALRESGSFMLVYPERLASSVLFEAGCTLALDKASHYFVR
jgi:hypothetical protein